MLIIAIGHGTGHDTDPFTCSTDDISGDASDCDAANALSIVCFDKKLDPEIVDELLVVDENDHRPFVKHHYTAGNDWNEEDIAAIKADDEAVCKDCGATEDVSFDADPYASELRGDDTPHWMCKSCRHESAMDI